MDQQTTLRTWLLGLYEAHGHLTPELVREAARPEESPAHGFVFNVPPEEAAEAHYLERAHRLIQTVRVTVMPKEGGEKRQVRFFHAIPGEEASYVYEPLTVIRTRPEKFQAARTEALRRLRDAERAVTDLDLLVEEPAVATRTRRAAGAVREARQLIAD